MTTIDRMTTAKLRYRTPDGALHDTDVAMPEEDCWLLQVDPDTTLDRLPPGTQLLDLQLVRSDRPKRDSSAATILSRVRQLGAKTVVHIG